MARYIDADALLENLKKQYGEDLGWQCTINMSDVGMMIDDAPTEDVVEVKHAYWKVVDVDIDTDSATVECTNCGYTDVFVEERELEDNRFCPGCGAKMDKKEGD